MAELVSTEAMEEIRQKLALPEATKFLARMQEEQEKTANQQTELHQFMKEKEQLAQQLHQQTGALAGVLEKLQADQGEMLQKLGHHLSNLDGRVEALYEGLDKGMQLMSKNIAEIAEATTTVRALDKLPSLTEQLSQDVCAILRVQQTKIDAFPAEMDRMLDHKMGSLMLQLEQKIEQKFTTHLQPMQELHSRGIARTEEIAREMRELPRQATAAPSPTEAAASAGWGQFAFKNAEEMRSAPAIPEAGMDEVKYEKRVSAATNLVKGLQKFSGTPDGRGGDENVKSFIRNLEDIWNNYPLRESSRFLIIGTAVTGSAASFFSHLKDKAAREGRALQWTEFRREFEAEYENRDEVIDAMRTLRSIQQSHYPNWETFARKFRDLVVRAKCETTQALTILGDALSALEARKVFRERERQQQYPTYQAALVDIKGWMSSQQDTRHDIAWQATTESGNGNASKALPPPVLTQAAEPTPTSPMEMDMINRLSRSVAEQVHRMQADNVYRMEQSGVPRPMGDCYRCKRPGHLVKDCKVNDTVTAEYDKNRAKFKANRGARDNSRGRPRTPGPEDRSRSRSRGSNGRFQRDR
jgi:hypothetical protein